MRLWGRPLSSLLLLCAAALLSWPVWGHTVALCLLAAGSVLLLLHHIANLSRLRNWLRDPTARTLPSGSGSWEDIFSYLMRLLKRQRTSEFALSRALERFERAGEVFPDAVVLLNDSDGIIWCNPRAEDYFGLLLERDYGTQITYILRQPQFSSHLKSEDSADPLTLRILDEYGERVVSVQLVPYGNSQKLLLGRDITLWERIETTRRDFIANVSHELRTPLTVVRGFLETLEDADGADPALLERSLKLMSQQTLRMTRLVDDLLTLSRLENPAYNIVEEKVNVPGLIQSLQDEARALSAGGHTIDSRISSDDWLLGAPDELRSAFSNLVTNAVRYTPRGGIIELSWLRQDGKVVFAVRDSGIGIEPQHVSRLTERFYRVDKSRSRATGGTGLGLAIVKHIVNRHQGRLDIESEPGKGSTFSITFPATRLTTEHDTEAAQSATAEERLAGR
jgi:two-component system phosphate regulon sensor histidine kinase PhoR